VQAVVAGALERAQIEWRIDKVLLGVVVALLGFSLVMVFSVTVVDESSGEAGYSRILRHAVYIGIGCLSMALISLLPPALWQRICRPMMLIGVLLLALVLVPGIGHEVNGSRRWIVLGSFRLQPSELMKMIVIIFMADYLTRRRAELKKFRLGVFNVALVMAVVGGLLLAEPDMGTLMVLVATVFGMMYLSGVRFTHLALCLVGAGVAAMMMIQASPYRLQRWMSFQDPFADPFNSGFQLSQALIAFGRGEWFGAGLGQSIQKLYYLPHASNDFLAAVIAEELGMVGIALLIMLYVILLWRGFAVAAAAEKGGHDFSARLAHGVVILISMQAMVNLGVNMGVLPTKGLTLPLMSYGGSSMVVTLSLIGLLLAVDRQTRRPAGGRRR
jgi:cell division protein FtsW